MSNSNYNRDERLVAVEQNQKSLMKQVNQLEKKIDSISSRMLNSKDYQRINQDVVDVTARVKSLESWLWRAIGAISMVLLLLERIDIVEFFV